MTPPDACSLLAWYDRHRRILPWRARPGEVADPYRVWLSEIMLQQTTVAAVIPYYERFTKAFPSVQALAAADEGAVMAAWAGLGYYARARNLHACARAVAERGCAFPASVQELCELPGIGQYTARAIGAIAFGIPVVPVDGNVERVTARIFGIEAPLPGSKPALAAAASVLGEPAAARARPSDFAQALFDLGATICTRAPACALCPWSAPCQARRAGNAADLPRKTAKRARPVRHGAHFWVMDGKGRVLLRRRPPTGLLGGMTELPGTAWRDTPWPAAEAQALAPVPGAWRHAGSVLHVFTHFELRLDVYATLTDTINAEGFLRDAGALAEEALPSVMRKCVAVARKDVVAC
jgi:A/G-specific adenine glycosylase